MSSFQATKLGDKYILLDLIGTGGMAEVYRGKLLGDKGFEKLIVIKRLLPHVAQDKEMVRLFIGEAKLAALLQHENIAATFDFGELDNNYFLAMEYLFGKDLYTIIQRAKECKNLLGAEYALMIALKICEGMDYAHDLRDLHNDPLNIIHRDLSPHNIFITYDGKVKIIDFGIAKAEILDTRTKAGVVKGKVSYMSPEQLSGAAIDSRSDIFSIGILLYEMLSKRRMYSGDTATLIRKCMNVEYEHLENINPDLPFEVYSILHKALAGDAESRYQSCSDMQSDIENVLFSLPDRPDSRDLKIYIRHLFKHDYESEKKKTIKVLESVSDQENLLAQDKTVILRPEKNRNIPQGEKTELYDPLKEGVSGTTAFSRGRSGSIISKWQEYKEDIFSRPLHKKLLFLVAPICLIAIMAFLLSNFTREEVAVTPSNSAGKDTELSSPPPTPVTTADSHQTPTVKQLLQLAEKSVGENRLLEPKNYCAFKFYQDILRIDPDNRFAIKGLQQIPDRYVDLVEKAIDKQRFSDAERLLQTAITAFPQHDGLNKLKRYPEIRKQAYIQELFYKAEQRLSINKLITPPDDAAFFYYKNILTMDPGNRQAKSGLLKIADRYASMAEQACRNFDFSLAGEYVKNGLAVVPDHTRLLEIKNELRASKPEVIYRSMEKNIEALKRTKPEKIIRDVGRSIESIFSN